MTAWRRLIGAGALVLVAGCAAVPPPVARVPATAVEPPQPLPQATAPGIVLTGDRTQGGILRGSAPADTISLTLDGQPVPLSPDRRFVIGFDRDAAPVARLVATLGNGRRLSELVQVTPRAWDISRLASLPKYPVPEPEFARIRPSELAQIAAARAQQVAASGWRTPFLWPATGRISTLFGSQRIYANGEAGSYHSGIDIAKPAGAVVLAPADGVVTLAAETPFTLEGLLLLVDHGGGLNSAFMHLSRIDVRVGQQVRRGQPIGLVGATGRATGPHLHWGLRWNAARLDPLLVTGPMPVAD